MKTLDIIHAEHRALAAVLQALRSVVGEIRGGNLQVDFRLLAAMLDYIVQVPEKLHHPKEDRCLFPRLRGRSAQAAMLIDTLERQHVELHRQTIELLRGLIHYQSMGAAALPAFDALVQPYVEFSWQHISLEETELMPLARVALSEADWTEIDAEFATNVDPYAGAEGEFEELFSKIVTMTPAPYGLGAGLANG